MEGIERLAAMAHDDADPLTPEGFEQWVALLMRRKKLSREQAVGEVEGMRTAQALEPGPATLR